MIKKIAYLYGAISVLLLVPAIYFIPYCVLSEKLMKTIPPIEENLLEKIEEYESFELICQPPTFVQVEGTVLTPRLIKAKDREIYRNASTFSYYGFNDETANYIYPVLKLNFKYTRSIETLRVTIFNLKAYINETGRDSRKLYCYLDSHQLEDIYYIEDQSLIISHEETEYKKKMRQELRNKYEILWGESLLDIEDIALGNFRRHTDRLRGYLSSIKTARLAHEPHRPMIRFIGVVWFYFEVAGLIVLCGTTIFTLRKRSMHKKRK